MKTPICNFPGCRQCATVAMPLARRGGRNAYMCDFHARRTASYYTDNDNIQGNEKKTTYTAGVEFETGYSDLTARAEFIAAKYLPSRDCTVDVEYKSPIYHGLNSMSKTFETFDRLIDDGHLVVDNRCGTHTHYGNSDYLNATTIEYLRRFYHSLFIPLCESIKDTPMHKRMTFWGRDWGEWAAPINRNTNPLEHTNFINLQHNNTIEFRLPRYRNAKQMMRVVKLTKAIGNCIVENFIKHFNDTEIDTRRYKNITEYRKHKAQMTGQKIVKLYQKAIAEI